MYFFIINGTIKIGAQKIMSFVKFLTKYNTDFLFYFIKYNNYNTKIVISLVLRIVHVGCFGKSLCQKTINRAHET